MPPSSHDATIRHDGTGSTIGGVPRLVPALSVLWHGDLARVGEVAVLEELALGRPVSLSRLAPLFGKRGQAAHSDLADRRLSRSPAIDLVPTTRGQIEIRPGAAGVDVEVQGAPLDRAVTVTPAEIEGGVVIAIARRIALCLHHARLPAEPPEPTLGLVGGGPGLERVRQDIRRVADLDVPVLIRGETGTGKELVARSVVAASKRAGKPFVAVNMATLPTSMAAAELFGHERGAFTGAAGARAGFFGEAAGGTLFLDEVGLTPPDVQAMLLRTLETGEVLALGSGKPRKFDVRILAATDLQLESAMAKQAFSEPLFQRLAGFQIRIPPLRKRREDFGELFLHFLKDELTITGELSRLVPDEDRKPFISASKLARLAIGSWSGNVRALRNAVRQIVIASRGQDHAAIDAAVEELAEGRTGVTGIAADGDSGSRPVAITPPPSPSPSPSPSRLRPSPGDERGRASPIPIANEDDGESDAAAALPWEISNDLLLETLRKHNWSPTATAAALRIPRTKLYGLMDRHPDIRKASDVPAADLLRLYRELAGNLDQMANHLSVSRRGLQLRMSQLLGGK